jgi:hypothetical protein
MARWLFAVLLLAVFSVEAQAYLRAGSTVMPHGGHRVRSAYQGPGDAVAGADEVWSLRCASAAKATGTTKVVNIRRTSGGATDVVCLASGAFDSASATTFCAATTCFVTTWYGQINGVNMTQATAANQPQLLLSGCGIALPCVDFNSATWTLSGTALGTLTQPVTVSYVAKRASSPGTINTVFSTGSGTPLQVGFYNVSGNVFLYAGILPTAAASEGNWHAVQNVLATPSSFLNVDGVGGSSNLTDPGNATTYDTSLALGTSTAAANKLFGQASEIILYRSALSAANQNALCHNQFAFWGTVASC